MVDEDGPPNVWPWPPKAVGDACFFTAAARPLEEVRYVNDMVQIEEEWVAYDLSAPMT